MAMAAINAATMTALRWMLRRRFCAARRISTGEAKCRSSHSTPDAPAAVNAGAVNANPSSTKNALPNPSHAGPVVSAATEQPPATSSARAPANSQRGVCWRLRSIVVPNPRLSATTGFARAPSQAGSQAATSTEPSPKNIALPTSNGVR